MDSFIKNVPAAGSFSIQDDVESLSRSLIEEQRRKMRQINAILLLTRDGIVSAERGMEALDIVQR